jgi:hypothetical protein
MVNPACQDIANQLQDTRTELAIAQQDFLDEPPNSETKQKARKEVVRLFGLMQDLERSLRDCEGLPPFPQPIRALFTSTVRVATSTPVFTTPAGGTSNVQTTMTFSDVDYRLVEFTFPSTPIGSSVGGIGPATVTNVISASTVPTVVTGTFERSTGHIDMTSASFDIRQSLAFTENGTVDFKPLTTRTVPSPMAPGGILTGMPLDRSVTPGRVILVGSSVLGGALFFKGTLIDLIIDGVLSAFPPV